jgi:hypothetical protein
MMLGTTSLVPAVPTAERRCQAKWATGCRELATAPAEAAVRRGQRPALAEPAARTVRRESWKLVPTESTVGMRLWTKPTVGMRLWTEPTVGAVCRAMTALSTQPTAADQMGSTLLATVVTAQ